MGWFCGDSRFLLVLSGSCEKNRLHPWLWHLVPYVSPPRCLRFPGPVP